MSSIPSRPTARTTVSTPPVPRFPSELPRMLGGYFVAEQIGAGGMGVVHRAVPVDGGPALAVKILAEHLDVRDGWLRFQREMDALEALSHPNTVRLYDRGWWRERPYFVMELVKGPDLPILLKEVGLQSAENAGVILHQLASALDAAHRSGLVHRDLKPSNVMLNLRPDGEARVKLLDFGLVFSASHGGPRITAESLLLGTPGYVAPEGVASPWALDYSSDVYALAMVAFYLRTGSHLFQPKDVIDREEHGRALSRGVRQLGVAGGYSERLTHLLVRCLQYDPADRPSAVRSLREIMKLTPLGPLSTKELMRSTTPKSAPPGFPDTR